MSDLAAMNLRKIDDHMATSPDDDLDKAVVEAVDQAKAALSAGDQEKAIALSS
jgi:hypothetical protein